MSKQPPASGSRNFANATSVLVLISTGLGILISIQNVFLSKQSTDIENKIKQQQETREETGARVEITMKVYSEVMEAVKAPPGETGVRQQRAAIALVDALLKHDPLLQSEFQEAIRRNSLPTVEAVATESVYAAEQVMADNRIAELKSSPPPSAATRWGNYDFDIFWCEASDASAEQAAKAITAALIQQGAQGRVRTRVLPTARNNDPGYRNDGFLVAYNDDEEKIAEDLMKIAGTAANTVFGNAPTFGPKVSKQKTKWYLSAFVCPDAYPPRARASKT